MVPVFLLALWVSSCETAHSPHSADPQNLLVQETLDTDHWADIDTRNSAGLTQLHEAVRNKNLTRALMLIQRGADVNLFSDSHMNPLYYAADCGQVAMLRLLLDNGALIDAKSTSGWGPLLITIERGHTSAARELILSGANVHTANNFGWTALHSAASKGNTEILNMLIEQGADVNTRQFPDTVLHWAAIKGKAKAAQTLIDHGALIDQRNTSGAMPLHLAISYSHLSTVKVLLDSGANPNVVASNGFTPLLTAYKWPGVKNRERMALLLRLYGAE